MAVRRNVRGSTLVAALLALALGLTLVGEATAAKPRNGLAEFQKTNAMNKRLKNFGVRLDGVNAARLNNGGIGLQVHNGNINVQTNRPGKYDPVRVTGVRGWVRLNGRLRFQRRQVVRRGARRVGIQRRSVLMGLRINLNNGVVRGRFGDLNSQWVLMGFNRSQLRFSGSPTNPRVNNIRVNLRPNTRNRLNRILRTRAFRNAPQFANVSLRLQMPGN